MDLNPYGHRLRIWLFQSWRWLRSRTWKQWLMAGLTLTGVGLAFLGLLWLMVLAEIFGPVPTRPELNDIKNPVASELYASDGSILARYYIENRSESQFSDLPPSLVAALISTEDARFFNHGGIDARSLLRVFVKSILAGDRSAGGGSTLTQQLAKNIFPRIAYGPLSMPVNKVREMVIARRLESVYDKEQILTLYLNTVPFGEGVFGIATASQRFFSKPVSELRTEESAVLVAMLKATTYYNPRRNPERALKRRNVVLSQMNKYGYLTKAITDSLQSLDLTLDYRNVVGNDGPAAYFREKLRLELLTMLKNYKRPDGRPWNLYTDGLRIYTTIDPRLQRYAEEAVDQHMQTLQAEFDQHWDRAELFRIAENGIALAVTRSDRYRLLKLKGVNEEKIRQVFETAVPMRIWDWNGVREVEMSPLDSVRHYYGLLQAGFVAMQPSTGQVKAWVGGINFRYLKYDHVTARRQVGSTFKPIVYAAAISEGLSPCEYFENTRRIYPDWKDWSPGNADAQYGGYYTTKGALANSVNTVSAEIMMRSGVNETLAFAGLLGLNDLPRDPTIVLGTADLRLLDMVNAYAAFADQGMRRNPVYLLRIEDPKGNVILELPAEAQGQQIMEPSTARLMTHMLKTVVDSGTAQRLRYRYGLRGPLAGKTGTTQKQADGWFIGYTPNLVAGAWVGGADRNIRFRSLKLGQGSHTALPIFGLFMQAVQADAQIRDYAFGDFSALSDLEKEALDCPLFVEELPGNSPIDWLIDIFKRDEMKKLRRKEARKKRREERRARRKAEKEG